MVRRKFLFMLMSLEIMMNAAALASVLGSVWAQPDGQVMFILDLTLAAERGVYRSCDCPSVLSSLPSFGCGCC